MKRLVIAACAALLLSACDEGPQRSPLATDGVTDAMIAAGNGEEFLARVKTETGLATTPNNVSLRSTRSTPKPSASWALHGLQTSTPHAGRKPPR